MPATLRSLIAEYYAMEEMDRAVQDADSIDEADLIGLTARAMRRREIMQRVAKIVSSVEGRSVTRHPRSRMSLRKQTKKAVNISGMLQ